MRDTFTWNAGVSVLNPRSPFRLYGMDVIESAHLPDDKAYILPGGQMAVPPGMLDKIQNVSVTQDTHDVSSFGDGYTQRRAVIGHKNIELETIDGDTLTVERMTQMSEKLKAAMDKQMDKQMGLALRGEPKETVAAAETEAMEADPAWGSF